MSIVDTFYLQKAEPAATGGEWTRHVHPDIPILWIENYYIEMDLLIAIPVYAKSELALKEIARGGLKKISEAEAQALNDRVARSNPMDRKYLEETLAARWRSLKIHCDR